MCKKTRSEGALSYIDKDAVRLGAIKSGFDVRLRQFALQQSAGMMPSRLEAFDIDVVYEQMIDAIFQFLRDIGFYDPSDPSTAERRAALDEFLDARHEELLR